MTYPPQMPPFAAQQPAGPQKRRGKVPLILASVFGPIAVVLLIFGIVSIVHFADRIDGFTRVPVGDAGRTVHLDAGHYIGYLEHQGSAPTDADVHLDIRGDAAVTKAPSVGHYGSSLTYSVNSKHGAALFTITIAQSGTYHVTATSDLAPAGTTLAIGTSIATSLVVGVLLIIGGAFLFIAAIILLIVGLVMRYSGRNQVPPPGFYPGGFAPGGFAPGGYQPGGYPPGGPTPGGPPTTQ